MTFVVRIRRMSDDREVDHVEARNWEDIDAYRWFEGNYGCDCNRYLYFERAIGGDPSATDVMPCGDSAYRIVSIKDADGYMIHAGDLP